MEIVGIDKSGHPVVLEIPQVIMLIEHNISEFFEKRGVEVWEFGNIRSRKTVALLNPPNFTKEIEAVINRCSMENGSNTPDFILAEFLRGCLIVFNETVNAREKWHGRPHREPGIPPSPAP